MTLAPAVLRERIACPNCGARSIHVERITTIIDKDRHRVRVEGNILDIECGRCGSVYSPPRQK